MVVAKKSLSEHTFDEVLYDLAESLRIIAILISQWYPMRRTEFSIN